MADLGEDFSGGAKHAGSLYDFTFTVEREGMNPQSFSTVMSYGEVEEILRQSMSQAGINMPNTTSAYMSDIQNINISVKPHGLGNNAVGVSQDFLSEFLEKFPINVMSNSLRGMMQSSQLQTVEEIKASTLGVSPRSAFELVP